MSLGKRLKKLRLEKDEHQSDIAKVIGVSQSTVTYYEKDTKRPTIETLVKLSDYFNVSLDYLLGKTEYPNFRVIEKEELEEITGDTRKAELIHNRMELKVNGKPFELDERTKEEIANFLKIKGYL